MATKVMMEALSPTMEEGRLVKWNKNEGDVVKAGDVLAEVETDKAIMELVARGDGVLRARLIPEGTTTPVGQLIGVIAAPDEDIASLTAAAGPAAPAPAAAAPEAPAAPAAPPAPAAAAPPVPAAPAAAVAPRTTMPHVIDHASEQPLHASDTGGRQLASPLARRMASERGLDINQVRGSGPGGRIIKRDIEEAMAGGTALLAGARPTAAGASAADYTDQPLTQIRKTIARRLAESIGPIPTFYLTAEFDLGRVTDMRAAMAAIGPEYKVSVNDIILKAVAVALTRHPEVNSHWMGDKIRQHSRVHVGMAVAMPEGLITPVIFDANQKGLSQISQEARELAKRARERKLQPHEYTGATMSVSNLGMLGIDEFTAIINPPEAAILAVGAVEDKPVVINGAIEVRKRMRVTLSCDHRVIDGALGAQFLQSLRRLIENPLMLVY
ncbi:MAG: pyruvate dehydrogenase complex dihydrolipoamide acetyltransferase [Gemmatimonadaceae bacterium]|nr:pyruvate dehydrogenase complex dihydrolipoamide acetyltransferase [Gemmatimonadaceae bacterium]